MKIIFATFEIIFCLFLMGCAGVDYVASEKHYAESHYQRSADIVETADSDSAAVLPNLYTGSAYWMNGDFNQSISAFRRAEEGIVEQDESWNLDTAYLARTCDGVMMDTYLALGFLASGRPEEARVAFNRLDERQGKVAIRNQKDIEERKREIEESKSNAEAVKSLEAVNSHPQNQQHLAEYDHLLDDWGAYADYENPASRFFSGLYRILYKEDGSDAEKAVFQMKKVYGMTNSAVVGNCLKISEDIADSKILDDERRNLVFVVFEDGFGPSKKEWCFDLVIPIPHSVIYAGVALPELVHGRSALPYVDIVADGAAVARTEVFCDYENVAAAEFKRERPGIIAAEITRLVIKVAVQATLAELAYHESGTAASIAVGIGGTIATKLITHADTRNWNLLPKTYQLAVLRRPASGRLTLHAPNGTLLSDVTLPAGGPSLVYFKLPAPGMVPMCFVVNGH